MISASHNPYYDNGIKLLNGDGEKKMCIRDSLKQRADYSRVGRGADLPRYEGAGRRVQI